MTPTKESSNLSKSKFLAGCQCPKKLYLRVYEPESCSKRDEAQQAKIDQGQEVGRLATKAFSGGVRVEEDYLNHHKAMERTQALMNDKNISAIFEAAFLFDGVGIRVDILERQTRNRWRMFEVKSSSKLKDEHYRDVAIQKYILENSGLKLSEACLMHLNRDYVHRGKEYDLSQLFTVTDLAKDINDLMEEIPVQVAKQHEILTLSAPPMVEPSDCCTSPSDCEFYDLCNPEVPEHWLGRLPQISKKKLKELMDLGIELIHDIPESFKLSELQKRVCLCVKTNKPFFGKELSKELNRLKYPLYFMDFESSNPAIPRYNGMRPFDQIPFQWSVHVQRQPGGDLEHYEFLAQNADDPRETFIDSLLAVLEDNGRKSHIVVYTNFEVLRLNDLSRWLPKYAPRIKQVKARLWDLHAVIKNHVYHPKFYGSFSIKDVLPAIVPHMTYEGMEIAEGTQAGWAYNKLVREELSETESKAIRDALLEYCCQDTMAMVELMKVLQNKAKS